MKKEIKVGKSTIAIVRSSVVGMQVDAIVNAANKTLLGGGGVDGAIHRAAGKELLKECKTLNGCKTGEVKMTKAYNITNAKFIVHAVGPVYHGEDRDAELLANAYTNSLDIALTKDCKSIAFPCISTGVYGYPIDEATQVSYNAVKNWLIAHQEVMMKVYFCCFRDVELEAYEKVI